MTKVQRRQRRRNQIRLERSLRIALDPSAVPRARRKAARYAACLAERLGILRRPAGCCWCRRRVKLERHHPDHDEPLTIVFLCRACHELADSMTLVSSIA